jgi:hypothetical protein
MAVPGVYQNLRGVVNGNPRPVQVPSTTKKNS